MSYVKTTDLKILRKHPNYFTWGAITEFYDFGPYTICKFKRPSDEDCSYHIWVNGKDLHISYGTLDQAIIAAVAHNNLEENEARWMTIASCKLLGIQ
jgi:hypothetical protein